MVVSFFCLLIFSYELAKTFMNDTTLKINTFYLFIPAFLIPILSQINSALINNCKGNFLQLEGYSSFIVGILLICFVLLKWLELRSLLLHYLGYVPVRESFYDDMKGISGL